MFSSPTLYQTPNHPGQQPGGFYNSANRILPAQGADLQQLARSTGKVSRGPARNPYLQNDLRNSANIAGTQRFQTIAPPAAAGMSLELASNNLPRQSPRLSYVQNNKNLLRAHTNVRTPYGTASNSMVVARNLLQSKRTLGSGALRDSKDAHQGMMKKLMLNYKMRQSYDAHKGYCVYPTK